MNKTIALTFTAAVVLMAASASLVIYGHRVVANRMSAERNVPMYDRYGTQLDSWERAAGLMGLLAVSVTAAGAMLWDRETQPRAGRGSVLGLDEGAARRIVRTSVPWNGAVALEIKVDGSKARSDEEESLTPLERVIRDS